MYHLSTACHIDILPLPAYYTGSECVNIVTLPLKRTDRYLSQAPVETVFLQPMYTLKKSLGQHFLKDENICRKIISILQEHEFKQLLEVGPGGGALTKYIIDIPGIDFKAVELDN